MLVNQNNPVGVELFSYVNTFAGFMLHILRTEIQASQVKLHISSVDIFSRKQRWFWSKRRGYTTTSQTTALCSYEKSYTFREDSCKSVRLIRAVNTNFKLTTYPLESAILHNTRKKVHGRTWR